MQNLALNWVVQGLNIVYVTLELSEDLCGLRLDSMLTGYSTKEVFKRTDDVTIKIIKKSKRAGALRIVQLPNGINVNDLKAYLKELQIQHDIKIDGVILDYLDLMSPISERISVDNLYLKDKYVSEELRNLAVEEDILLASASQLIVVQRRKWISALTILQADSARYRRQITSWPSTTAMPCGKGKSANPVSQDPFFYRSRSQGGSWV